MSYGFGQYGIYPFDLGGGDEDSVSGSIVQDEHQALLDDLSPGFDTSEDLELYQELYAEAVAIAMIWAMSKRLRGYIVPEKMLESLRVWEEAMGARPSAEDTDCARRQVVAGKFRGLSNNALSDIESAVRSALGDIFVEILTVDPADAIQFYPGINPGPPGFEWFSNITRIGIKVDSSIVSEREFAARKQALFEQLNTMLPCWVDFVVGEGDGFVVNQGIVGKTFL